MFRSVTADELAAAWPRATLVDVRSREEHATAHVPGSLNIPLDELAFRLSDLPATPVYLLCGSGKRSRQAARFLTDRGYTAVNVAGGITEWYRAGHPVTYHQVPEDPPGQGSGHAPERLRTFLQRLLHRTKHLARSPLAGYPRGYLYWMQTTPQSPFKLKESTTCLSSAFTTKTSPRQVT